LSSSTFSPLELGQRAPPFRNTLGVDGRRYSLSAFDDKQILVIVFIANRCPTARVYGERMKSIQRDYKDNAVQLIAVNSDSQYLHPEESYAQMVKTAEEREYNFPYLKDEDQNLAKGFGALVTLHAFILDRERRLRYRGRIDNSRDPLLVRTSILRNAVDDLLANRVVKLAETKPFACPIDYV